MGFLSEKLKFLAQKEKDSSNQDAAVNIGTNTGSFNTKTQMNSSIQNDQRKNSKSPKSRRSILLISVILFGILVANEIWEMFSDEQTPIISKKLNTKIIYSM